MLDVLGSRHGLRLAAGVLMIGAGAAALAWPSATFRVIGLLFGLNLVVTGTIRAGLLLVVPGYPELYRIIGVFCGVLTAIAGVLCLRDISASVVLLLVVTALGWMVNALLEALLTAGEAAADLGNLYVFVGSALIVAAVIGLIRPGLDPAALVAIGGAVLVCAGIAQVARAIAGLSAALRAAHRARV
ncbi:hypothetical protein DMB66_11415 [Actinoplanes sp. ATCC 53533]|uniref:DUF308 domain-containing protein n=1 Tax=Actinoplanes sp. ATCC 53533 TaxID=1288362 RepID=UPI000F772080|nr:DUF308 domain-containing protein [Actinoplanes sp. ATCC 53533]RSM69589.1 hypothetical protein DMB66_11415 [Actinoplanes sp. ATCC 53533]